MGRPAKQDQMDRLKTANLVLRNLMDLQSDRQAPLFHRPVLV